MYITVWRNTHRDPFIDTDSRDFIENYYTYEDAKVVAEKTMIDHPNDPYYFDYQIYQEVNQ